MPILLPCPAPQVGLQIKRHDNYLLPHLIMHQLTTLYESTGKPDTPLQGALKEISETETKNHRAICSMISHL